MAADTDGPTRPGTVERHDRRTRWFHAAVYIVVLVLLGTGWWLITGQEGNPSPAAMLTGVPDTELHKMFGWALIALVLAALVVGRRGVMTFARGTLRFRRGDLGWFARWPRAVFTGRFGHHDGHFDPGQRILNVALVATLGLLVVSGAGLVLLHGGPLFAVLDRIHRWTTYAVTALIFGHVVVAAGILPGYRGVWRSMHLGGKLDARVARRLWPAWSQFDSRCPPASLLGGYLLDELGEEAHAEVQRHLDRCWKCCVDLASLRDVVKKLDS